MNNNNVYVRLEIPCCRFDLECMGYSKEKSWSYETEDVYIENVTTVDSLKKWILYFSEVWKQKRLESIYKDNMTERIAFPLFNCWKNSTQVGFCSEGWIYWESSFAIYVYRYASKICKNKYLDFRNAIGGKIYDVDTFIDIGYLEYNMNFLTEELIDIELKRFLNGEEVTEEIEREVYYPEMVRRGYIDIINDIISKS